MTGFAALDRFLETDPADTGCDEAMQLLHAYAELHSRDPEAAELAHPGVAAHLRQCGPCAADLDGLLAAISAS